MKRKVIVILIIVNSISCRKSYIEKILKVIAGKVIVNRIPCWKLRK